LSRNGIQIGVEGFENLLMSMVGKKNFEKTYIRESTFPFIWELAKQIPI
jgi:hypothetical protein